MLFTRLIRRLVQGSERSQSSRGSRAAGGRHFVPRLLSLEDRVTPASLVPFKESLTVTGLAAGDVYYVGNATHLGNVTAVLHPDNTYVKYAASGDTVTGHVTPATATTGTISVEGGTGRFAGATGLSSYVISQDPKTGATNVDVSGAISYGQKGKPSAPPAPASQQSNPKAVPFKIDGGGPAPSGLPLFPGGTAPHSATGNATHLGKYTGDGTFELGSLTISQTGEVTATFQGSFIFVAANGDKLATRYGTGFNGTFTGRLNADGTAVVGGTFDAIFTVDGANSTGRFAGASGSWRMIAHATIPLIPNSPFSAPFNYTWSGEGSVTFAKGKK